MRRESAQCNPGATEAVRAPFLSRWLPTVATIVLVIIFIRLGLWQQHKAEAKQALQTQLDQRLRDKPVTLSGMLTNTDDWRYRRVQLTGHYETRHQILLDNQVHEQVAGLHVITPFRPDGSNIYILINRGWIEAPPDHSTVPTIATPTTPQTISGYLWQPPEKFFTLAEPPSGDWQPLWQNMDMRRYASNVPFAVQPMVVRLDPQSTAAGFVRAWPRPAERIEMHIGYAYQWYGFALTLVVIYIVLGLRKNGKTK